jgi:hypothetical protein
MRLLAPVDQQAHGNAMVTPSQRILIRFHPVVRHWNAGLFSAFSVLAPQAAPRLQSVPATLVWVYSCVKSKPVLKTGVPSRVPRSAKKGETVTIRGKLNGTNPGTSAPLTAPFFERFWGSTGWRNRCMVGSVEARGPSYRAASKS